MAVGIKRRILDFLRKILSTGPLEILLVRLMHGKLYGTLLTRIIPNHYQYPPGSKRQVVRDGIMFQLDISDMVDWFIYFGFRENSQIELYKLMHEGQVFIDVGANMGSVTMHAAQILKGNGKVVALEPDPLNYQRLITNLSLNNFNNIHTVNRGAGMTPGNYTIHSVEKGNAGMNRILPADDGRIGGREITVTTLDLLVEELSLKKVDLIKIDTEGFEMNVLAGARNTIERFKPRFFIEIDDGNLTQQGSSARELVSFMADKGYTCRNAENGNKIKPENDFANSHFDLIAIHEKTDSTIYAGPGRS